MTRTEEIAKLLKVDMDTAEAVHYEMDCSGIDYSECTTREFNRTARECYEIVKRSAAVQS